jgi:hypothetical protein
MQPGRLLAYFGAWTAYGLMLAGVSAFGVAPFIWSLYFWLPSSWLLGFMSLSCWYLIKVLPARETPWTRLIGTWVGTSVVVIGVWLSAILWWADYLLPPEADVAASAAPTWALAGVIAFSITILIHYLVAAFERSQLAEKAALQSRVLAREAELRSLRSQLDPHFLFNSLNSVAALIGTDVAAARRMCYLMAGFFRKSVALGKEESIPLAEEIQLVETFLAIEEVRFGDRLRKKFEVAEETLKYTVPPLVLQPLVENAVHHGIAHLLEGGDIEVTGRLITDQQGNKLLQLTVANACDPDRPPSKGTGTGLGNVRSRLDTLYGNTARVDATVEPTHYRVTLLLPAIAAPEPAKKL